MKKFNFTLQSLKKYNDQVLDSEKSIERWGVHGVIGGESWNSMKIIPWQVIYIQMVSTNMIQSCMMNCHHGAEGLYQGCLIRKTRISGCRNNKKLPLFLHSFLQISGWPWLLKFQPAFIHNHKRVFTLWWAYNFSGTVWLLCDRKGVFALSCWKGICR